MKSNEYYELLGAEARSIPKSVLGAIAVSAALNGSGLPPEQARNAIFKEWWALHRHGIVPQRPPGMEMTDPDE